MVDRPQDDYTQQNRRAWNEIAQVRAKTFPPASFFAAGGSTLDPRAAQAARDLFGDLKGLRLIHLQCATGEETLSWAVLGAQPVGVDISDGEIAIAGQKAQEAGLPVRFIAADVYALPGALPADLPTGFDVVYTGGGAIVWLPDLRRWAQVVAGLLRPGGRLLLMDEHPFSSLMWVENGQLQIETDYFSRDNPEVVTGWYHFKGGEDAQEIKYEFTWPLGDIVTAVAQAGLIIERLEEFPGGPEWRFGQGQGEALRRLPGQYLLAARKQG